MGFFTDAREGAQLKRIEQMCENSDMRPGTRQENCERCRHVQRADCVTGLVCSGRPMSGGESMIVLANYTCDNFDR